MRWDIALLTSVIFFTTVIVSVALLEMAPPIFFIAAISAIFGLVVAIIYKGQSDTPKKR